MASTERGPIIAVVGKFMPSCTASRVPSLVPRPIIRLIQPVRTVGAGVGVLDLLDGGEVRAVRDREAGGLDGGELA